MKHYFLKFTILFLVIFIIINNFIFIPGNILSWDVFGYYLYLPLKFIYNDLGLKDMSIMHTIINKYHNTATLYQVLKVPGGDYIMKYSMGLSFFYAPFFFIGHIFAKIFNYPADGFSAPYQYSIFVGGIIYSIIGIWALSKVLIRFFNDKVTILVLLIIVFATNYYRHILMNGQNAMSHNYLFTTYSLILWLTILWHESHKAKYVFFLAIVCGLTILSRPSEVVCLIIPVLWGVQNKKSFVEKIQLLYKNKKQIILFFIILLTIGMFQFIYWKIHTGKFLYYSYGGNAGEGFEFFSPYILEVLFSFRKGWLIYTPVMIFSIIGFYFIYKENRKIFYALFIYFIFNLYIVSSWSCWWYAQSFSQRGLIQSYPVMAIGLGYFLMWLIKQKRLLKNLIFILILGLLLLNLFQTWQIQHGILSGDRMTRAYYFRVFGKTTVNKNDKKLLLIKRSFNGKESFTNENEYQSRLLKKIDFEKFANKDSIVSHSGKYSLKIDSLKEYAPDIELPYYEITNKDHAWIRITAYIYPIKIAKENPFCIVAQFNHGKYKYKYKSSFIEKDKIKMNKWNKISFDYLTPEVRKKSDYLKTYIWNSGKSTFYIDDFQVEVFEKKVFQ